MRVKERKEGKSDFPINYFQFAFNVYIEHKCQG